jgi:hypothetical protein
MCCIELPSTRWEKIKHRFGRKEVQLGIFEIIFENINAHAKEENWLCESEPRVQKEKRLETWMWKFLLYRYLKSEDLVMSSKGKEKQWLCPRALKQ